MSIEPTPTRPTLNFTQVREALGALPAREVSLNPATGLGALPDGTYRIRTYWLSEGGAITVHKNGSSIRVQDALGASVEVDANGQWSSEANTGGTFINGFERPEEGPRNPRYASGSLAFREGVLTVRFHERAEMREHNEDGKLAEMSTRQSVFVGSVRVQKSGGYEQLPPPFAKVVVAGTLTENTDIPLERRTSATHDSKRQASVNLYVLEDPGAPPMLVVENDDIGRAFVNENGSFSVTRGWGNGELLSGTVSFEGNEVRIEYRSQFSGAVAGYSRQRHFVGFGNVQG